MARAIDSEVAYQFLTEQLVKETGAFSKGVNKGLNIARSAMRNSDAIPTLIPPNEPLTLEELREMDEEPVYVVPKDKPAHCGGWCGVIVWKCDRYSYVSLLRDADSGWGFEKYGKTWIAFRRPPEGEVDA